jgi:hypothetical protein
MNGELIPALTPNAGHLKTRSNRWIGKRAEQQSISEARKHWRVAKYERELLRYGDDIRNNSRFANAQVIGFQKIIKKYQVCIPRNDEVGCVGGVMPWPIYSCARADPQCVSRNGLDLQR